MRRTPNTPSAPRTISQYLDALQLAQRAARADLEAARSSLAEAEANLQRADQLVIATAELLGLEIEK